MLTANKNLGFLFENCLVKKKKILNYAASVFPEALGFPYSYQSGGSSSGTRKLFWLAKKARYSF